MHSRVRAAVAPADAPAWMAAAVRDAGGEVVPVEEADALVWADPAGVDSLARLLERTPGVRWVQLPFAGVEPFRGLLGDGRLWTCAKGAYADACAEHALALLLAGLRQLPRRARARSWGAPAGTSLFDGRVTIVGGGGIASALVGLLVPFRSEVTVVRHRPAPVPGAARVVGAGGLHTALAGADAVVVALALTTGTEGIIDAAALGCMEGHAWLVNVARGRHVVTDDLVEALRAGAVGGAALDVTEPEPLPDGHPLWELENCLITPHTANPWGMARPKLVERIAGNVGRFAAGQPLLGVVDPVLGY